MISKILYYILIHNLVLLVQCPLRDLGSCYRGDPSKSKNAIYLMFYVRWYSYRLINFNLILSTNNVTACKIADFHEYSTSSESVKSK